MAKKMGGSQSKFTPDPQDVWYKMKLSGKHPRYLQTVMQAIADLKEVNGSTQSRLIEYIQSKIDSKNLIPKPRNVTMQVKRALNHAVKNGLVKVRAGRFNLALNKKDFIIFKNFRADEDPLTDCGRCKKKKRKKGRRGRSRGRRRSANMGQRRHKSCAIDGEPTRGKKRGRAGRHKDIPEYTSSLDNFKSFGDDPNDSYIN